MLDLFLLWQCDFADWALFCCTAACYIQSTGRTSATTILSSKWTSGLLYFAVLVTLPHNNLPSVMVIWKFDSNPLQYGQQMMIGQPRPVLYMPYPAVRLLYPLTVLRLIFYLFCVALGIKTLDFTSLWVFW